MLDLLTPEPNTDIELIPKIVDRCRATFHTRRTTPLAYRKQQLKKLWWGIKDNEKAIVDALSADLRKSAHESTMSDVVWLLNDIIEMLANIDKYAKEEKLEADFASSMSSPKVRKEPMGVVLIIGAFNYPFQLALGPLIGAIAAGNTAVVKPSEICVQSAAVLTKIVRESLDPDAFDVVNGAIPETTELLKQKWDKICYTGNGAVGRIVATAAAKNLTPTLLELGGMNPAIITKNADIKLATRRLVWGKVLNAGQVCLSPDYALVPSTMEAAFVANFAASMKEFFPEGTQKSEDLTRLVNERHFDRVKKMLDNTKGKIVIGGHTDRADLFIDITLVKVESEDDSLLSDEIFGPLFPYMVIDDVDDQISFANRVSDTPLALYAFTNDKTEQQKILTNTRSGGASINDAIWHAAIPALPFGGVGESGTGNYRGKFSFDAFTHRRTYVVQPKWMDMLLSVRYPPYTSSKLTQYKKMMEKKPSFGRDGITKGGWFAWLGLGKYVIAIVGAVYLKKYFDAYKSKL